VVQVFFGQDAPYVYDPLYPVSRIFRNRFRAHLPTNAPVATFTANEPIIGGLASFGMPPLGVVTVNGTNMIFYGSYAAGYKVYLRFQGSLRFHFQTNILAVGFYLTPFGGLCSGGPTVSISIYSGNTLVRQFSIDVIRQTDNLAAYLGILSDSTFNRIEMDPICGEFQEVYLTELAASTVVVEPPPTTAPTGAPTIQSEFFFNASSANDAYAARSSFLARSSTSSTQNFETGDFTCGDGYGGAPACNIPGIGSVGGYNVTAGEDPWNNGYINGTIDLRFHREYGLEILLESGVHGTGFYLTNFMALCETGSRFVMSLQAAADEVGIFTWEISSTSVGELAYVGAVCSSLFDRVQIYSYCQYTPPGDADVYMGLDELTVIHDTA
jgi:hypothetical protein